MTAAEGKEIRDGISLSNLDQPLFAGSGANKRDLVDYLDAISERMIPVLRSRPLSVMRAHRGEKAFMQKNLPKYTPEWVDRVTVWAESSKRDVSYALCDDRRTLLWFANQRAIEYHPSLAKVEAPDRITHLVLDIDPPEGKTFAAAVTAALLVREVLVESGLAGVLKTSGAKGLHVFVPIDAATLPDEAAAATGAIANRVAARDPKLATTEFLKENRKGKVFIDSTRVGGATVVAAYSPRARPDLPVSLPIPWNEARQIEPGSVTIKNAISVLGERDPWVDEMPEPQVLPEDLVDEGRNLPSTRVQAMQEGRRRRQHTKKSSG